MTETAIEQESVRPTLIYGSVPPDINGIMYKNGVGRIKLNNNLYFEHWFDGDGMATSLQFFGNGQSPLFTTKYILTNRYLKQGNVTDKFLANGAWTQCTDWYRNILAQPNNPSNTNLFYFNNKLFSLCEGGYPIQLDKYNLNTINNAYTFNNKLSSFFGAHPKIYFNQELDANVMINIGISISPPSTNFVLYIYSILENETEDILNTNYINLPYNCLIHDFLITNNYIIILLSPYIMSSKNILKSVLFGADSLGNYQEWRPELGSYLYILDKHSLNLIINKQIETISSWHWINGYDDENNNIYTKLLAFPVEKRGELEHRMKNLFKDDSVEDITADLFGGILGLDINLKYDDIDISLNDYKELNEKIEAFELPEINTNYMSSSSLRYLYTNSISENGLFLDSLQKIDFKTNENMIYSDIDKNIYLYSPLFVESQLSQSSPSQNKEDDGYIICYGYNVNKHNSLIYIFNASNITKPLTIMELEYHVPILFHGTFVYNHDDHQSSSSSSSL